MLEQKREMDNERERLQAWENDLKSKEMEFEALSKKIGYRDDMMSSSNSEQNVIAEITSVSLENKALGGERIHTNQQYNVSLRTQRK